MNEMLGKIVRALVTVKADWLGTLADLLEKLTSPEGESWLKNLRLFLRKESPKWEVEALAEPQPLNTLIRVDRTVRPTYPDWMGKVLHPDLELSGPADFDLASVERWLHEKQKTGCIVGNDLYAHLKKEGMLQGCLTLRDGEEIQKNGIEAFRKFFKGKALFLWGSVVENGDGNLDVPCLYADGDEVVIGWYWLGRDWNDGSPAGRLAS